MPFGAFARIAEALDGLIRVSELATERVGDPSEVVRVGDQVKVRVVGIDADRRRLSLSIRWAAADRYRSQTAIADALDTRILRIPPV